MPAETAQASGQGADPALLTHWLILGRVRLPGRPEHVGDARRFVARKIGSQHEQADVTVLLTSELVTNAVTHSRSRLAGGTVDVVVAARPAGLLITVTDDGSDGQFPAVRHDPGSEGGNGLLLVESLADAWGFADMAGRTTVWFRLNSGR